MKEDKKGFTLIELLIVVAIIAILAAIAIPNFLESQIRAKVSRARSDLRTVATGVEAYAVDWNTYPANDGLYNVIPVELTTPIAYLTKANMIDPFGEFNKFFISSTQITAPYYTYMKIVTLDEANLWTSKGKPCPNEAIDSVVKNPGAFNKYGKYRMVSVGPDKTYMDMSFPPFLRGSDVAYDATNGTVSFGNILFTQKSPQGFVQ